MRRVLPYILILSISLAGCEINQKEILPEDGFTKIFNHPEENLAFYPESVLELSDGYIFVSAIKDEEAEIEYPNAYLVRTNLAGEMQWAMEYDWLAPAANLFRQGSDIGFVAMNQQFEAYLVLINPADGSQTGQQDLNMTMPLYAFSDKDDNLVVLGYDFVTRSSHVSKFNTSLDQERTILLPINEDLQYDVQRHLNKTGQEYPFYIGEYATPDGLGYFVNCFYNYTLRSVFLDVASLGATGNIYSYQTDEGLSSLIHKDGNLFGLTSYYEGNNFILPETEINVLGTQNVKDLPATHVYELTEKAGVKAGTIMADTAKYELFISQTNSNSLILYQCAMNSDSLINTHQRMFDEKVEVCDFIQTVDNGVLVLGNVFILGKYRRPVLVKFPEETFIPEEE